MLIFFVLDYVLSKDDVIYQLFSIFSIFIHVEVLLSTTLSRDYKFQIYSSFLLLLQKKKNYAILCQLFFQSLYHWV